jgi:hypothetical protein
MLYPTYPFVPNGLSWEKWRKPMIQKRKSGGRGETRTPDPLLAKQVLCQLSYTPNLELALILKHFQPFQKLNPAFVSSLYQN